MPETEVDLEDTSRLIEKEMSDDMLRLQLKAMLSGMSEMHLSILKMGKLDGWPLCIEVPIKFDVKDMDWYIPKSQQTATYLACLDLTGMGLLQVTKEINEGWTRKFDLRPAMLHDIFIKYLEGDF